MMGCDGCELWTGKKKTCYAGILTERHELRRAGKIKAEAKKGKKYDPSKGKDGWPLNFDTPMEFPGRMREAAAWPDLRAKKRKGKPWLNGLPRCIFVSDMGDALSKVISFEYLEQEIIQAVKSINGHRHVWMWLTKQPQRMAEFSDWLKAKGISWPENLWPMTSVTTQGSARARVPALLKVGDDTTTRGLSVEPLWEEVTLEKWMPSLDWIIVGGESGPLRKKMDLSWARKVRNECGAAKVPFFMKQVGGPSMDKGGDSESIPEDLRIRDLPRRSRAEQIRDAGKNYREGWDRVPIARALAEKLDAVAIAHGKTKRTYLDELLRKHLPE
jgi:protein gp37